LTHALPMRSRERQPSVVCCRGSLTGTHCHAGLIRPARSP
jgi:hypothetical protein